MGVSANQARLMTLTARQHDLELRAQQISATKMTLSLQSQKWATDYSNALNSATSGKSGNFDQSAIEYTSALTSVTLGQSGNFDQNAIDTAKATYDAKTASISSQEKLLDLELTQINTEHSAVKTEYDAVKSLISDNVDKSFNVFG